MNWSNTQPSEPGLYWFYDKSNRLLTLTRVTQEIFDYFEYSKSDPIPKLDYCYWQGPLPVPEPPEGE